MENSFSTLKHPPKQYRPCAFWFLNHAPVKSELLKQIGEMESKGFGGFVLHARSGLRGGYLNSSWRLCIEWILEESQKRGLNVLLYDELDFPSGPAGGLIWEKRPDSALEFLELVQDKPAIEFAQDGMDMTASTEDGTRMLGFKIRKSQQYPDYLSKVDMAEFIRLSYAQYAEWFKPYFGNVIQGEFTDNACANFGYFRRSIPWTDKMPELFEQMTGLKLQDLLPSLFLDTPNSPLHRIIFWRFINELFLETYIKPIESICAENGIAATGHYCIESGLSEHVRQLGDRFDQKRHQHIPGVDMLGASRFEDAEELVHGAAHPLAITMTSSCAYFLHKHPKALCECFGLTAGWACTLAELRRIGGFICALGANICVPHGLYYSIAGHRKRECVPDFMHNTLWEHFNVWSDYTARIYNLTDRSIHIADTAILYPIIAQQASIELGADSQPDIGPRADRIDRAMRFCAETLVDNALPFEIIDEKILASAKCNGDTLMIPLPQGGYHCLRTILLPSAWIIGKEAVDKLNEFISGGGLVISIGEQVSAAFAGNDIKPATIEAKCIEGDGNWSDISLVNLVSSNQCNNLCNIANSSKGIVLREWKSGGRNFAMLHNHTRRQINDVAIKCNFPGEVASLDLDSLELKHILLSRPPVSFDHFEYGFKHDFAPGETLLLTDDEPNSKTDIKVKYAKSQLLSCNTWSVQLKGDNVFKASPWTCETHDMERTWRANFNVADNFSEKLTIGLDIEPTPSEIRRDAHPFMGFHCCYNDIMTFISDDSCTVNGHQLENLQFGTKLDRWIYEQDITEFIHPGENTIEIRQPDVRLEINNAVPEPPLLIGNFSVEDGTICPVPAALPYPRWDDSSLKNYSGTMAFSSQIEIPEELRGQLLCLSFSNVHEILELQIDGKSFGTRVMPPYKFKLDAEVTSTAKHDITMLITNTPSNRWSEIRPSGIIGKIRWLSDAESGGR